MKYEVIGLERKTGTFESEDGRSIAYDNFVLHTVAQSKRTGVTGHAAIQVKVKAENSGELIAAVGGAPEKLVGHVFDFEFGSYNKLVGFELVK